jgi:hypothetical protein
MARTRVISGLVAGLLLAGLPVAMPLAAAPDACAQEVVDAAALPAEVSLDDCDIEGATITSAGLRVDVPPPGQGRTISGLTTTGEVSLEVSTSDDGVVSIATAALNATPAEAEDAPVTAAQDSSTISGADNFADATGLPVPNSFMPTVGANMSVSEATLEPGEPAAGCGTSVTGSVWYRIERPGSLRRIKLRPNVPVAVYRGTELANLRRVACVPAGNIERRLTLAPKAAHYLQVGIGGDASPYSLVRLLNGEMRPDGTPPCDSRAHVIVDQMAPRKPLKWRFHAGSTPPTLTKTQALRGIKRGIGIITGSKNDCGLADTVSARHRYLGATRKPASLCVGRGADGVNVVSFGVPVHPDMLGLACSTWTVSSTGKRHVVESDIRLSSTTVWTTKPDAPGCRVNTERDLVSVVAHEAGHVFGLDHPLGTKAMNQTMSASQGTCNGAFRTLGRGDIVGLRKLY